MSKQGKRIAEARKNIDRSLRYELDEAIKTVLERANAKFDETVDVAVKLGVNPKHPDQMVRGTVVLPHGTGKTARVAVFAKGEKIKEAEEAGADEVGAEDLVKKVQGGFLDFDKAVATPDMMSQVGRLGKILGPRGLMPNPKSGTVTMNVARAVREIKAGKLDFRVEKAGIIHVGVGKVSFGVEKIKENILAFIDVVLRAKPPTSKGAYFRSISISSTMGPGVWVDTAFTRTR